MALLSQGAPYHRFTAAALADPNGFAGVNGIFRFNNDGTSERGLAVLEMTASGPVVISPAPTTFQRQELLKKFFDHAIEQQAPAGRGCQHVVLLLQKALLRCSAAIFAASGRMPQRCS